MLAEYIQLSSSNSELAKLSSAETVVLDPLTQESQRFAPFPFGGLKYDQLMSRSYFDDGSINASVYIYEYLLGAIDLGLNVTVDLNEGYLLNINVTTQSAEPLSHVDARGYNDFGEVLDIYTKGVTLLASSPRSSFIGADGFNHTRQAQLRIHPTWYITSPENQTEEATLRADVTYFNGSVYKKVIFPFLLTEFGCINTNIENAEKIAVGQTVTNHSLSERRTDEFFKVHLLKGETVSITSTQSKYASFYLFVYNSSAYWMYSLNSSLPDPTYSSEHNVETQNVTFTSPSTDWWFINVRSVTNAWGFFVLEVVDL